MCRIQRAPLSKQTAAGSCCCSEKKKKLSEKLWNSFNCRQVSNRGRVKNRRGSRWTRTTWRTSRETRLWLPLICCGVSETNVWNLLLSAVHNTLNRGLVEADLLSLSICLKRLRRFVYSEWRICACVRRKPKTKRQRFSNRSVGTL